MTRKLLWAPWRMNYIKNIKKEKGCLFCRVFKSKNDPHHFVVCRSPHALAMLNLYPYNNGHLMVAPARHVASLEHLSNEETADMMKTVTKMKCLLDRAIKPAGYNIGINIGRVGGAGIDRHMHIHIVPRWLGDTNFMPVIANTKVISQSLLDLYRQLRQHLLR